MTFGGVPLLDWLLLAVMIGFGIEAYVTTRPSQKPLAPPSIAEAKIRDVELGKLDD